MSEPIRSFTRQSLNIDDIVVCLKDGCKFIGQIIGFVDTKVKICRLSHQIHLSHQTRPKIMEKLALTQMMSWILLLVGMTKICWHKYITLKLNLTL